MTAAREYHGHPLRMPIPARGRRRSCWRRRLTPPRRQHRPAIMGLRCPLTAGLSLIRSPQIFIDGEESSRSSPQTSVNICAAQKFCGGLNWSGRIAPGGHGHLSLVLGRPAVVNRSAGWRLSKSLREQLPARLLVSAGLVTGTRCAIRKD